MMKAVTQFYIILYSTIQSKVLACEMANIQY